MDLLLNIKTSLNCTKRLSENRETTAKRLNLASFSLNYSSQIDKKYSSNQLSLATTPILGQTPEK